MRPAALSLAFVTTLTLPAQSPPRPNVVLCMADDQGWGDVGYNGHPALQTPTLDAMASAGLRFDRFYAAAPVCSPTRGSVLTGRHPNRFGCFTWGHPIQPREHTLAEVMRDAGYTTGHFGKWHLGSVHPDDPTSPGANGFDAWVSSPNFYENSPLMSDRGTVVETEGESSQVTVDAALQFIRTAAEAKTPFLAVVWFGNPHVPHQALPKLREPYADRSPKERNYFGEIQGIDRAMAHLRDELRALEIADRTIVWYTSDNGSRPPGSTGGLRGKKGELWEGGIRVPSIVEWPDGIPESHQTDIPAGTVDIYPTILALCGIAAPDGPEPLDGVDLTVLVRGEAFTRPRPLGFWVYPARGRPVRSASILERMRTEGERDPDPSTREDPTIHADLPGRAAWIDGAFKLHRIPGERGAVRFELYDLTRDPAETEDLAPADHERVDRLRAALQGWQESVARSCAALGG